MQELSLNFPTVVILLVILALAVLAIRRMTRRGLCLLYTSPSPRDCS